MPKKAVALFFLLAFLGAGLFIYFTFPRTKDEIPKSNNQMPLIPKPGPNTPNAPNGVPVPETVPHPNTPKVPPGPTLHVMAWASAADAQRLSADTDSFTAATGRRVALTIESDPLTYRHDLQQAFVVGAPPDLCLVSARDFSGLDPAQDLVDATPINATPPRAVAAFTVDGKIKAVPDEFSVEVLFYNPSLFDQAGIGYPGSHWTWDILEADARAITALKLKDAKGQPTFAIEMPANFDMWNILCAAAGAPALDPRCVASHGQQREGLADARAPAFARAVPGVRHHAASGKEFGGARRPFRAGAHVAADRPVRLFRDPAALVSLRGKRPAARPRAGHAGERERLGGRCELSRRKCGAGPRAVPHGSVGACGLDIDAAAARGRRRGLASRRVPRGADPSAPAAGRCGHGAHGAIP